VLSGAVYRVADDPFRPQTCFGLDTLSTSERNVHDIT
jgi:hypothetical protein